MNNIEFLEELKKIKINISVVQQQQLDRYYEILVEKNKTMNLTGIIEKEQVYLKHFFDSLTLNKIIDLNKVNFMCDLGSGAGFPGIVIKILFPNINITLVDSLNKRIIFLNDLIKELNLDKINTVWSRIEEYSIKNKEKYDLVTARAVAPSNVLLEIGVQLVKINGRFITMKGKDEIVEKDFLSKLNLVEEEKIKFLLPKEESERTLTSYKKNKSTPSNFPRKYSEIKKNKC